jgi:hypothetical protein
LLCPRLNKSSAHCAGHYGSQICPESGREWRFVGLVDVDCLLGLGVEHPEDFLDVVSHLLEVVLGRDKRASGLSVLPLQVQQKPAVDEDDRANGQKENKQ